MNQYVRFVNTRIMGWWRRQSKSRFAIPAIAVWGAVVLMCTASIFEVRLEDTHPSAQDEIKKTKIVFYLVPPREDGGGTTETPYRVAGLYLLESLKKTLDPERFEVEPRVTPGTVDTLLRMDRNRSEHAVGLAQADVIYHYMNGGHPQFPIAQGESNLRTLARIFPEWVHVYKPKQEVETGLARFGYADCGKEGSGTLVTATTIGELLLANWSLNVHRPSDGDVTIDKLYRLLRDLTRPLQKSAATTAKSSHIEIRVLSPSTHGLGGEEFEGSDPALRLSMLSKSEAKIIEGAYGREVYSAVGKDELIRSGYGPVLESFNPSFEPATIQIDALLLATKGLPGDAVASLVKAINYADFASSESRGGDDGGSSNQDPGYSELLTKLIHGSGIGRFSSATASSAGQEQESASTSPSKAREIAKRNRDSPTLLASRTHKLPIAVHRRIRELEMDWASQFLLAASKSPATRWVIFWLLVLFAGQFIWNRSLLRKWVHVANERKLWGAMVGGFIVFHLVIGALIWVAEHSADSFKPETDLQINGIDAAWSWMFHYVFAGTLKSELRSEFSIFLLGVLKGGYALSSVLVSIGVGAFAWKTFRKARMKKHIIIVGWHEHAVSITQELDRQKKPYQVAIGSAHSESEVPAAANIVCQDDLGTLLAEVGFENADGIIVLADKVAAERERCSVDMWVLRVLQAIASREHRDGGGAHVVAEIASGQNESLAKKIRADETVCVKAFGASLLAQMASRGHGIGDVITELFQTSISSNEIYFEKIDSLIIQGVKTFSGLARGLGMLDRGAVVEVDRRRVLIGLRRSVGGRSQIVLNPSRGEDELREGDEAIVIARRSPRTIFVELRKRHLLDG